MIYRTTNNANEAYCEMMNVLKTRGEKRSPRGSNCLEVINYSYTITNPRDRIISIESRKFPLKGALAEFLWYMTGNPKIDVITPFLPHWSRYSDDGVTVNSNYGARWKNQISGIVKKLKNDPETRQAVVDLYSSSFSEYYGKDTVCTPSFQFLLRDGILHLVVFARSRDVVRGECIDQFTFSLLLETVANELRADVGTYTCHIGSLHIYEEHYELLDSDFEKKNSSKEDIFDSTRLRVLSFWSDLLAVYKENVSDFLVDLVKQKSLPVDHFLVFTEK